MTGTCGIYRIVNLITGKTYLGSAVKVLRRLNEHRYKLTEQSHANRYLQFAWNKYGATAFSFEFIAECQPSDRREREQRFIDAYLSHGLEIYNLQSTVVTHDGFRGERTAETRAKCSAALKRRWADPDKRAQMINGLKKRWDDPKFRARRAAALEPFYKSSEWRASVKSARVAGKGYSCSAQTKAKISAANTGRRLSGEHRKKLSAAVIRRLQRPGEKEQLIARGKLATAIRWGLKPGGTNEYS